jgi:hypothetical protein
MAEQRDLSIRGIAVFGLSLFATIVLVMLVDGWLTGFWRKAYVERQPPPLPVNAPSQLPPEPRLQVNAPVDLLQWRAKEDALVDNYEWVDRNNGVVRIPISRAMELVEQRGLSK